MSELSPGWEVGGWEGSGWEVGELSTGWEPFCRLIWDTYMMKDNQIDDNGASM